MARTRTSHIRNMRSGGGEDDTREGFRIASDSEVLEAVDDWSSYDADPLGWKEEHPGQILPEFAAVIDRANITDQEAWFVEVRYLETHDNGDHDTKVKAHWCQLNVTNVPDLQPSFFGGLRKIFNARRTSLNLDLA